MQVCDCCQPKRTYLTRKALYKHQRSKGSFTETYQDRMRNVIKSRNEKGCKQCGNVFMHPINVFCSSSCAATFNNTMRSPREPKDGKRGYKQSSKKCEMCTGKFCARGMQKFCSTKCMGLAKRNETNRKIEDGEVHHPPTLRRYLLEKHGHHCFECKRKEWNCQSIPLELDHIDGDHKNNFPENLRMLCPNCHALTPTFKAKNRGHGRHKRRERYQNGLSF